MRPVFNLAFIISTVVHQLKTSLRKIITKANSNTPQNSRKLDAPTQSLPHHLINPYCSLQYKPFDDASRCALFKHSCKPPICERSFAKRKIDFKFSLLLQRRQKSGIFNIGSDVEIVESITIENTGTTNLWINSFHNDITECESTALRVIKSQHTRVPF